MSEELKPLEFGDWLVDREGRVYVLHPPQDRYMPLEEARALREKRAETPTLRARIAEPEAFKASVPWETLEVLLAIVRRYARADGGDLMNANAEAMLWLLEHAYEMGFVQSWLATNRPPAPRGVTTESTRP